MCAFFSICKVFYSALKTVQGTERSKPEQKKTQAKLKQPKLTVKKKKVLEESDNDNFEFDEPATGPAKSSRSRTTRGNKINYKFDDSDDEVDDGKQNSYHIDLSDDSDDGSDF